MPKVSQICTAKNGVKVHSVIVNYLAFSTTPLGSLCLSLVFTFYYHLITSSHLLLLCELFIEKRTLITLDLLVMGKRPLTLVDKFDIFIVDCHVFSYLSDGELTEAGSSLIYMCRPRALSTSNCYLCLQNMLERKKLNSISNHILQVVFSIFVTYISLLFLTTAQSREDTNTQKR